MHFDEVVACDVLRNVLQLVDYQQQVDSVMFGVVQNEIRYDNTHQLNQLIKWLTIL